MFEFITSAIATINHELPIGILLFSAVIGLLALCGDFAADAANKSTLPGGWHDKTVLISEVDIPNETNVNTDHHTSSNNPGSNPLHTISLNVIYNIAKHSLMGRISMEEVKEGVAWERVFGKAKELVEEVEVEGLGNGVDREIRSYGTVGKSLGAVSASGLLFWIIYAVAVVSGISSMVHFLVDGFMFEFSFVDCLIFSFILFAIDVAGSNSILGLDIHLVHSLSSTAVDHPVKLVISKDHATHLDDQARNLRTWKRELSSKSSWITERAMAVDTREKELVERTGDLNERIVDQHNRERKFEREARDRHQDIATRERRLDFDLTSLNKMLDRKDRLLGLSPARLGWTARETRHTSSGQNAARQSGIVAFANTPSNSNSNSAGEPIIPENVPADHQNLDNANNSNNSNNNDSSTQLRQSPQNQVITTSTTTPPSTPPQQIAVPSSSSLLTPSPSPPQSTHVDSPASPSPAPLRQEIGTDMVHTAAMEASIAALREEFEGILAAKTRELQDDYNDTLAREKGEIEQSVRRQWEERFNQEANNFTANLNSEANTYIDKLNQESATAMAMANKATDEMKAALEKAQGETGTASPDRDIARQEVAQHLETIREANVNIADLTAQRDTAVKSAADAGAAEEEATLRILRAYDDVREAAEKLESMTAERDGMLADITRSENAGAIMAMRTEIEALKERIGEVERQRDRETDQHALADQQVVWFQGETARLSAGWQTWANKARHYEKRLGIPCTGTDNVNGNN